jgi:Ca-activated chloride channel family protein
MELAVTRRPQNRWAAALGVAAVATLVAVSSPLHAQQDGFKFKSGVELVNVTVTVTDRTGRFIGTLRQEDFTIYDDDEPQEISHFSAERVPVSLGIVLDTSGSMVGDKMTSARTAIDRFLFDLLDPQDEVFMYRFSGNPELVHDWTTDREAVSRRLRRVVPNGGTAMYDAVAEAVPIAAEGQHRKKALLLISDGNDTNSQASVGEVKQLVRETEVLVYAIGIDGQGEPTFGGGRPTPPVARPPIMIPFPFPGGRGRGMPPGGGGGWGGQPPMGGGRGGVYGRGMDDRVNAGALREITDDSGGRTEIVRDARDLEPATANIADELSQQYYLGYPAPGHRDGRWHNIKVAVKDPNLRVRARRGYIATP